MLPLRTTGDLLITNQLLYRLSHTSIFHKEAQTNDYLPLGERLGEKSVEQLYTTVCTGPKGLFPA